MVSPTLLSAPRTRLIASLVDGVFAFACIAPGLSLLAFGIATETTLSAVLGGIGMLLGIGVAIGAQIRLLRDGQTIGKRQQGLRIVAYPSLQQVELVTSLGMRYIAGRMLLNAIPMIGPVYALVDVLFVFSAERRCLHDRIADTIVVDDTAWTEWVAAQPYPSLFTTKRH